MIDLSKIKFIPSKNFGSRGTTKVTHIILHCPVGTLSGTIATFQNIASKVSAHYVVDRDGSIVQMVKLEDAAWHAMHLPNQFAIGIEMVDCYEISRQLSRGCMSDKGWLTNPELTSVVNLVTTLMQKFNIPITNIIGHNDPYLRQFGNNHTDPGPYFPWLQFRQKVCDMMKPGIFLPPAVKPAYVETPIKTRKPRGRKLVGKRRKTTGD